MLQDLFLSSGGSDCSPLIPHPRTDLVSHCRRRPKMGSIGGCVGLIVLQIVQSLAGGWGSGGLTQMRGVWCLPGWCVLPWRDG